jgi:hypothetical protein
MEDRVPFQIPSKLDDREIVRGRHDQHRPFFPPYDDRLSGYVTAQHVSKRISNGRAGSPSDAPDA